MKRNNTPDVLFSSWSRGALEANPFVLLIPRLQKIDPARATRMEGLLNEFLDG